MSKNIFSDKSLFIKIMHIILFIVIGRKIVNYRRE